MTYQPSVNIPCILCGKPSTARKLCKPCYYKMKHLNKIHEFPLLQPTDVFLGRIKKTKTCWLWQGTTNSYGYGIFLLQGEKSVRAHRYSYELHKGEIQEGMVVMHSCDNPLCVNPDHLSIGTRLDNNRDAVKKCRNAYGEKNGHSRLTSIQINEILIDTRKQYLIAKDYGVTQSHISRIKSGNVRSKG